jgi:hypothetical protein
MRDSQQRNIRETFHIRGRYLLKPAKNASFKIQTSRDSSRLSWQQSYNMAG